MEDMLDMLGVEEARRILGELVTNVCQRKEAVVITRRSKEKAVLLDYEEYRRLRGLEKEVAARRVADALSRIRRTVQDAGIPESVIQESIDEVRSRR